MERRRRVLIVEDDPDTRLFFIEALRQDPGLSQMVEVVATDDCAQARAAAEEAGDRLAVVLLDRSLPDGDGLELARELRARWPLAAVVVLTGHDDSRSRRARSSIQLFLKPVRLAELIGCVRGALAGGLGEVGPAHA